MTSGDTEQGPLPVGAPESLLDDIAERLRGEPLAYAGVYGGRYAGWSNASADLDLILIYDRYDAMNAAAVRSDLVDLADRYRIPLDITQVPIDTLVPRVDAHPERRALFFLGPCLAGDPARVTPPETIALAARAKHPRARAALGAANRASITLDRLDDQRSPMSSEWPAMIEDLAGGLGYVVAGGKDRRKRDEQVAALLALLPAPEAELLERAWSTRALTPDEVPVAEVLLLSLAANLEQLVADEIR